MSPGQGEDETVIEAEFVAACHHSVLVIEERGLPLDELAAHGAGWQAHVEDLAAHLEGGDPGDWRTRWAELMPSYANAPMTSVDPPRTLDDPRARRLPGRERSFQENEPTPSPA